MLTSLVLSLTLAAPVPPGAPVTPAGPLPRLVEVKAENGKVTIPVNRAAPVEAVPLVINGNGNGGQVVIQHVAHKATPVELSEVKSLKVYAADGKEVAVADAAKRLAAGGTVVVSADGKAVDPRHLRLFRTDVLVLVSPELVSPALGLPGGAGFAAPAVQFQVVPLQPNGLPGQPLVIPRRANAVPVPPPGE